MRKFVRSSRGRTVDDPRAPMRIVIEGGLPGHPAQKLTFTTDNGRKVVVRGGLPDILEGEENPGQRRITRGTGIFADDYCLVESMPMFADDEQGGGN
jgi:hypothetical protein